MGDVSIYSPGKDVANADPTFAVFVTRTGGASLKMPTPFPPMNINFSPSFAERKYGDRLLHNLNANMAGSLSAFDLKAVELSRNPAEKHCQRCRGDSAKVEYKLGLFAHCNIIASQFILFFRRVSVFPNRDVRHVRARGCARHSGTSLYVRWSEVVKHHFPK